MSNLFPAIQPFASQMYRVDERHALYVEQAGNPDGMPVLFLHGGPGGGCQSYHRQFFDPDVYHIILFDQRGCGRSRPHAELEDNTTQNLVADIEWIRAQLSIDQWLLFGGSWGSTLALVYAQTFPERVRGMVLRGIFLAREQDITWFYRHGASKIYPREWEAFTRVLPDPNTPDPIPAYYQLLTGGDEIKRLKAAKTWTLWEALTSTLNLDPELAARQVDAHTALSLARLECHYMINDCFLELNQILANMESIQHIPAIICHGRYDMICPVTQAYELHQRWPQSELNIVEASGHAATEPKILEALVQANRRMLSRCANFS